MRLAYLAVLSLALFGCVSMPELNQYARIVETAWLTDYQRVENTLRSRVVDGAASDTFFEVKDTLLDLNLPVISSDMVKGEIIARGVAPAPLTQREWDRVVESENPRLQALSHGWLALRHDPSNYLITTKITVRGIDRKSIVVIDYILSSPYYEGIGFQIPRVAPPQAVVIGANKSEKLPDDREAFLLSRTPI